MDLIELPSPEDPYRPPTSQPPDRRSRLGWLAAAVVVLLVVVVALVNRQRAAPAAQHGTSVPTARISQPSAPPSGSTGPNGSNGSGPVPLVACPLIRDEQSHLAYRCIDNYLSQSDPDSLLGLRIALNHEVEPGWVISEGSGDPTSISTPNDTVLGGPASPIDQTGTTTTDLPAATGQRALAGPRQKASPLASPSVTRSAAATAAQVRSEVELRTGLALRQAYGDNPASRTLSAGTRTQAGVAGYELVTEVTINPAFRQAKGLSVRTERLWVLGLPSPSGVSIFMLSIPDERKDLWSRAEATVATVHII